MVVHHIWRIRIPMTARHMIHELLMAILILMTVLTREDWRRSSVIREPGLSRVRQPMIPGDKRILLRRF